MKLPNDTEIANAKADAMKRFGRDEVLQIPIGAPIDFVVLVAPLNLAAYCAFADDQIEDLVTAQRNMFRSRLVWPAPEIAYACLAKRPALASKVAGRVIARAGRREGNPKVEPLSDLLAKVTPDQAVVFNGLSVAKARELISTKPDEELWAVTDPGLSLVMIAPDGDVWNAAKTREIDAVRAKSGIVQSVLDFAQQSIVWSSVPVEALLDDMPAMSADIVYAYKYIGGDAAEATCKSL